MKNSIYKNKGIKSFFRFFFKSINIGNFHISHTRQNNWFRNNSRLYKFKRYPWTNFICSTNRSYYLPYFRFCIFYIWRKSKNWFGIFITFSYPNNNNFSCIPFPSKSAIYESRIDRGINYCCNKGTKKNKLIK